MTEGRRSTARLDALLGRVCAAARVLPALVADNAVSERARLDAAIGRGEPVQPRWVWPRRRVDPQAWAVLDEARTLAIGAPAEALYVARLDELELDLALVEAIGDGRRVRPIAARRYGTGVTLVDSADGGEPSAPVVDVARAMLATLAWDREARLLPPDAPSNVDSAAARFRRAAEALGLSIEVRVEPRLAASAAAGERIVFLAERNFGERETTRLVAHELYGHLVAAANGRAQPLGVLKLGTAGSFADQEGVSLCLEEESGAMDGARLRTLAARVVVTHGMHSGASFGECALGLVRDHGLDVRDAVRTAERAFRGGGVARDAAYLVGWLRVRAAVARGDVALDELRVGRVGLADVETLRELRSDGLARGPIYRTSFSMTPRGTSSDTSPPASAAAVTRFDAT